MRRPLRLPWRLLGEEGEARIAGETLSVRCLEGPDGGLVADDGDESAVAVVGRSY